MKRLIITTAILSLVVITVTAQRHERHKRSHKERTGENFYSKNKANHREISKSDIRKQTRKEIPRNQSVKKYSVENKHRKKNSLKSARKYQSANPHRKQESFRGYYRKYDKGKTKRLVHDGHVNHYYKKRTWSAGKYHIYPRRPHFSIRWRPAWKTFYRSHFPSFRVSVHSVMITIPGYEANHHLHESAGVYGKVYEVFYDRRTKKLFLYLGAPYPRQDFTIVVTGRIARQMSRFPHSYFLGHNFMVSGFISEYRNQPEMIITYREQIKRF